MAEKTKPPKKENGTMAEQLKELSEGGKLNNLSESLEQRKASELLERYMPLGILDEYMKGGGRKDQKRGLADRIREDLKKVIEEGIKNNSIEEEIKIKIAESVSDKACGKLGQLILRHLQKLPKEKLPEKNGQEEEAASKAEKPAPEKPEIAAKKEIASKEPGEFPKDWREFRKFIEEKTGAQFRESVFVDPKDGSELKIAGYIPRTGEVKVEIEQRFIEQPDQVGEEEGIKTYSLEPKLVKKTISFDEFGKIISQYRSESYHKGIGIDKNRVSDERKSNSLLDKYRKEFGKPGDMYGLKDGRVLEILNFQYNKQEKDPSKVEIWVRFKIDDQLTDQKENIKGQRISDFRKILEGSRKMTEEETGEINKKREEEAKKEQKEKLSLSERQEQYIEMYVEYVKNYLNELEEYLERQINRGYTKEEVKGVRKAETRILWEKDLIDEIERDGVFDSKDREEIIKYIKSKTNKN